MTSIPHLAGTPQDLEQAEWIKEQFLNFGLDQATVIPYRVLLSYPDKEKPNQIHLIDQNGKTNYSTSGRQTPLTAEESTSSVPVAPNFSAYSKNGTVVSVSLNHQLSAIQLILIFHHQDGLVYVHYGQESDYEYLKNKGIDVTNKIVLARYGLSFRGNIVRILVILL